MSELKYSLDINPHVVFCHMRKTAGTSVVQALENSSCKLPRFHRNGQAWTGSRNDPRANIIRIWDMKRQEWDQYMRERKEEDRSTVVLEWNAPSFLEDLSEDESYEVFTCLRDPFSRFCSEFYFHDKFFVATDSSNKEQEQLKEINPAERRGSDDAFVEENRAGVLASEWIKDTLYWKRDNSKPFKVAINKPNYMVRWFCGLFDRPDVEITREHLAKAKSILSKLKGIMILGDPESYSLLRRYNFSGRLERVRVNTSRRVDKLMDISKEDFEAMNELDCELFAFAKELTEQRKKAELAQTVTLNFPRTTEQDDVMRDVDIIVPLKERGVLVRAVLEALDRFYAPRRLLIVSNASELEWVREQVMSGRWSNISTPIEVVDEDTLWMAQPLGLTRQEMEAAFNASIVARNEEEDMTIAAREFGWYLQQCIKLGIGLLVPSISENYVVWDADLLPMRRWNLCEKDIEGNVKFFTAILQRTARVGNAYEYLRCLRASTGLEPARPKEGGTFVTHHMVFNKTCCQELLDLITKRTVELGLCGPVDCRGRWPLAVLGLSHTFPRFSEYLTYASFMEDKERKGTATGFNYIPFPVFGMGGLRMRNATKFVEQLIESSESSEGDDETASASSESNSTNSHLNTNTALIMETTGGFSYDSVLSFANRYFGGEGLPPYLQLEHVYSASLLPPAPPAVWEYYRAYVHGDKLLPRLASEAVLARRKLICRRDLWWSRFEKAGCIFIHIPKNAGTSVERMFTRCEEEETKSDKPTATFQSQHFSALELREDRFAQFEQLFKFCIVRNPYDRLISAYLYLRAGGNQTGAADCAWAARIKELGDFDDFVRYYFGHNHPVKWAENELPTHFIPQHMFVCGEDGTLLIDAYLDMSDFASHGLAPLVRRGLPMTFGDGEIPHLRKSSPGNEILYNEEISELVFKAYEKDFTTFHFDRNSWRDL